MKAGQASSTARIIAASTLLLASEPRNAALVAPQAAAWCQRLLMHDRWLARSAVWPPTRAFWRGLEAATLPGILNHYWHRKRWIEAHCRQALQAGCRRLVVLGAGYDTLALRLTAEFGDLQATEFDHPATQAAKRRALHGVALPAGLRFEPLDLMHQVPVLTNDGAATFVVAEGVLMYLAPQRIDALFAALRQVPRLQLAFSTMHAWPDGHIGFRPRSALVERWLAWRGEPQVWALAPQALADFLAARGMRRLDAAATRDFTPRADQRRVPLEGENVALAETVVSA